MKYKEIKFGTDGWRAVIGKEFTFKNVMIVAQAIADYYKRHSSRVRIAVGYDTRFLSASFAKAVSEVLATNNIKVILSDRAIPTPTLSFTVEKFSLTAGVMITASHNPAEFNGIKIKESTGGAASEKVTGSVERLLKKNPPKINPKKLNLVEECDFVSDYIGFIRKYLRLDLLKKSKVKILVDTMHGSGNGLIKDILKGTGIKVELARSDINPSFEGKRPEPVVENLEDTLRIMKKKDFDIALVLDGDADRIAAIERGGRFLHPQKILGLLALHLKQDRFLNGGIVKTIAGSTMIDHIAKELKVRLFETPVGFKYISDLMIKREILAGGEEAGGMGVKDFVPERDGSLAGLLLVEMMVMRKKTMKQIVDEMESSFGRYYYQRRDLDIARTGLVVKPKHFPKKLLGKKIVEFKTYDGIKAIASDESWLMIRASGTEPMVRVYSESKSLKKAKDLLDVGEKIINKLIRK
ncbi:MAG: phosphoglucomutase/phosphomannomutase family protein [Candidatus Gygaella obscura]|nr:phosphoglucomutase/phosphomannomutase family protein [Candidatus Gygaella obscura]